MRLPQPYYVIGVTLFALAGAITWRSVRGASGVVESGVLAEVMSGMPRATIVVAFRLVDCGTHVSALRAWNATLKRGITVRGIVLEADVGSDSLSVLLDGAGLVFPVTSDSTHVVASEVRRLGFRRTPLVLVVDNRGRIRLADGIEANDDGWTESERRTIEEYAKQAARGQGDKP